jgi:hypothetical protein
VIEVHEAAPAISDAKTVVVRRSVFLSLLSKKPGVAETSVFLHHVIHLAESFVVKVSIKSIHAS